MTTQPPQRSTHTIATSTPPSLGIPTSVANPRPEWVVILLGGIFGLLSAFITPPMQAPDETEHFYRAYQISEGRVVPTKIDEPPPSGTTGGYLPTALAVAEQFEPLKHHPERQFGSPIENLRRLARVEIRNDDRSFFAFSNTAAYSPVPYLPQAFGIWFGRFFDRSPLLLAYAARIANLAAWLGLIAAAVRTTPVLPWAFVGLALTPMSLFLAASASGDAVTNGLCWLFIAQCLHLTCDTSTAPSSRDAARLAGVGFLVSLVKVPYQGLWLFLAVFSLSSGQSSGRSRSAFWLCTILMAVGFLGWMLVVRGTFSPYDPSFRPGDQLRFIASHPEALWWGTFGYLQPRFLWRTLEQFVGVLGWLDTRFPVWFTLLHLVTLAGVAAGEVIPLEAAALRRLRLVAASVGVVLCWLVCFVVLVAGTSVGQRQMFVQGRYFLPIAPLLLVSLAGWLPNTTSLARCRPFLQRAWTAYLPLSLLFMLWTLRCRYYP